MNGLKKIKIGIVVVGSAVWLTLITMAILVLMGG